MKAISFNRNNRSGNVLHIETDLAIINVRVGLFNDADRALELIEIIPNEYSGEPRIGSDTRHVRIFELPPRPGALQ